VVLVVPEPPEELLGACQKSPHPARKGITASSSRARFANFIVTPRALPIQGRFFGLQFIAVYCRDRPISL
jgi:hypothetical protein